MREPAPFDRASSRTKSNYCQVSKNKIHCSGRSMGLQSSKLPPHLQEEFCKKRCPIYKMRQRSNKNNGKGKAITIDKFEG